MSAEALCRVFHGFTSVSDGILCGGVVGLRRLEYQGGGI